MKLSAAILAFLLPVSAVAQSIDATAVRAYPFPQNLTAAGTGSRIAWTFNEEGKRNVFVAEAPSFEARKLTSYDTDDGSPAFRFPLMGSTSCTCGAASTDQTGTTKSSSIRHRCR